MKIKFHHAPVFLPAPPNLSAVWNITVRLYWDVLKIGKVHTPLHVYRHSHTPKQDTLPLHAVCVFPPSSFLPASAYLDFPHLTEARGIAPSGWTFSLHRFLILLAVIVLRGSGRRVGWGRGREGRKVLLLFLCLTISLTCPRPLSPRPQQTWPPGRVEPARQPAGCLFPASVTDRIFIACTEHSSSCKTEQMLLFPNAMLTTCIHLINGLLIVYRGKFGYL